MCPSEWSIGTNSSSSGCQASGSALGSQAGTYRLPTSPSQSNAPCGIR